MRCFISCACLVLLSTIATGDISSNEENRFYTIRKILSLIALKEIQPSSTDLPHDLESKFINGENSTKNRKYKTSNSYSMKKLLTNRYNLSILTEKIEYSSNRTNESVLLTTPETTKILKNKTANETERFSNVNNSYNISIRDTTHYQNSTEVISELKTEIPIVTIKYNSSDLTKYIKSAPLLSSQNKSVVVPIITTQRTFVSTVANESIVTTLPSIFDENLIPPLPKEWPLEDESWNSYDEDYYRERRQQPNSVRNKKSNERLQESKKEIDTILYVTRYPPVMGNFSINSDAARHEVFQTVTAIGKAMIDEPSTSSVSKEKPSYVTMPHDRHWYLWEGFAEQRSVNSFANNKTADLTQVYWRGFGVANRNQKGIWIMKVGCAASIFILIAAIASQNIKNRKTEGCSNQKSIFITNLATCFIVGHLIFIFGIQVTTIPWACGIVSLLLHFLHLLCCSWITALSIRLLGHLQKKKMIYAIIYYIPVWVGSAAIVLISFILNPSGYETRSFCWLSVEKGMLVSYIAPVCTLLLVNAGVCVACQKQLLDCVENRDLVDRSDLKAGVVLLPLEGIAWFLTIVALEDNFSYALDLSAAFTTIGVAFFILHYLALGGSNPVALTMPCQQFDHPTEEDPSALSIDDSTELALMQQPSSLSSPDGIIVDEYQDSLFPDEQDEREVY